MARPEQDDMTGVINVLLVIALLILLVSIGSLRGILLNFSPFGQ